MSSHFDNTQNLCRSAYYCWLFTGDSLECDSTSTTRGMNQRSANSRSRSFPHTTPAATRIWSVARILCILPRLLLPLHQPPQSINMHRYIPPFSGKMTFLGKAARQDVSSSGEVVLFFWIKGFHMSEFLLLLSAIVIRVIGHFYYRSSVLFNKLIFHYWSREKMLTTSDRISHNTFSLAVC
jgi:hypothetical protein